MNMNKTVFHNRILLLLAITLLAGCATQSPRPVPPQPQEQPPPQRGQVTPLPPRQQPQIVQPTRPARPNRPLPPSQPAQISSPAVMTLLQGADQQMRAGNLPRASAILQRALGIEPRNPFVYQRLAAVRLAQQQYGQVEALASKSNSLANNNPFIQADNWALIAKARAESGNAAGQRQAWARVKQLRLHSAALK